MPNVCDQCGQSNRAAAMFCIGCTGKLPGFAPSGPSALESMKALSSRTRGAGAVDGAGPGSDAGPLLPSETNSFWLVLAAAALVMMIGFMCWFLWMKANTSMPVRSTAVPSAAPVVPQTAADPVAPPLDRRTPALAQRPLTPTPASDAKKELGPAIDSLPDVVGRESSSRVASPAAEAMGASPRSGNSAQHVQAVEKFYRALSAADGKKAAAVVIPAKRGIGPFNEAAISRFYGSFQRPLFIRSIRPIDARLVEAKYSYQVSRTTCEGTAIVETEQTGQETLIRSIRANC